MESRLNAHFTNLDMFCCIIAVLRLHSLRYSGIDSYFDIWYFCYQNCNSQNMQQLSVKRERMEFVLQNKFSECDNKSKLRPFKWEYHWKWNLTWGISLEMLICRNLWITDVIHVLPSFHLRFVSVAKYSVRRPLRPSTTTTTTRFDTLACNPFEL